MQWYYAKGGEQTGPIEDQAFHDLVRSGQISADTPVWREGMANWMPYSQVSGRKPPEAQRKRLTLARDDAAPAASADNAVQTPNSTAGGGDAGGVGDLLEPLYRGKGWIRLIGIMLIVQGILMVPSIVGIVIAWLPIWMGITLTTVAKQTAFAVEANDRSAAMLALDRLRLYFKILGVLTVAGIVLGIVGIIIALAIPGLLHSQFLSH